MSVLALAKTAKQKTTVNMLADLTFEGFDDLHQGLTNLDPKRDAC